MNAIILQKCDTCGATFVQGYGYSIMAMWAVTGSAYLDAQVCDKTEYNPQPDQRSPQYSGQHWGCTPEHAMQALEKCLQEHMHVDALKSKLLKAHTQLQKDSEGNEVPMVIPRYSPSDEWAKKAYQEKGDNFHIVDFEL